MSRIISLAFIAILLTALNCYAAELTDSDLAAGKRPKIGDTVILKDFANCFPRSAMSSKSEKGKWWLKPYKTDTTQGTMLCVEERDRDNPQSCIAPQLTYNVNLEGTYDIWVCTYRPNYGGGVDIRLSRDKYHTVIDPWQEEVREYWPMAEDKYGMLVEYFYKTADMTGQNIHLRQPHGTYQTLWLGHCESHVAYIKLIKRSPKDVKKQESRKAKMDKKGVIIDRDGGSWIYIWGTKRLESLFQQIEDFQYGNIEALSWCFVDNNKEANFPHPLADKYLKNYGSRHGDKRRGKIMRYLAENNLDYLQLLIDRCHEIGIKIFVSHRAGSGQDYADPAVRKSYSDFLLYVPENYDIDGLTVDFTRHPPFFKGKDRGPQSYEHMNNYLRTLRKGLDKIGKKRGKHIALNASFYKQGWRPFQPESEGLDIKTWIDEELVDCIMPQGLGAFEYIEMCKGKKTKCYPRKVQAVGFNARLLQSDHPGGPTPADNLRDRPPEWRMSALDLSKGALKWYDAGADGIYLFNMDCVWYSLSTLSNLPYPELLREDIAANQTFGMRMGEKIKWLE